LEKLEGWVDLKETLTWRRSWLEGAVDLKEQLTWRKTCCCFSSRQSAT